MRGEASVVWKWRRVDNSIEWYRRAIVVVVMTVVFFLPKRHLSGRRRRSDCRCCWLGGILAAFE